MQEFFSESGSTDFDQDQGHSSSGSLPGIYSGTDQTELTTSKLRSTSYDPSKDLRKLSVASAGSDSMFDARERRPPRSLQSKRKRQFGQLNPAQRTPNMRPAPNIEMTDSEEEAEVEQETLGLDLPVSSLPKDYCIVRCRHYYGFVPHSEKSNDFSGVFPQLDQLQPHFERVFCWRQSG
jgi:hypothetical protein